MMMLFVLLLLAPGRAANPEFPEARVCEFPTSVGYGTWTGDATDAAGNTAERVRSACSAMLVHEQVLVTAAHCVDPDFQSGVFDEVARFGNHIEDDDIRAEVDIDFCEVHPAGFPLEDGRYAGPDVAVCILAEPAPYVPPVPILVPASCETDYIRHVAFEQASAHLQTAYPNSPYGFGVAPIPVTAVGYGFETKESPSAEEPCSLVHADCPAGNRRVASGYGFHERYFHLGGDSDDGPVASRVVPFVERLHELQYPSLPAWDEDQWPSNVAEHGVMRHGDSGGPLYFPMADGTWRVIGTGGSIGHRMHVPQWSTLSSSPSVQEQYYRYTAYASLPVYLPWVEEVVDEALGVDLTPCHTLETVDGAPRYSYAWTSACADQVSHYATDPDLSVSPWNGGCGGSEGGDDHFLTRECAGWDGGGSFHAVTVPTAGEMLLDFALAADPPAPGGLFELPATTEVYGTSGDDRLEVEAVEPHTSVFLGGGHDVLISKTATKGLRREVLAGAGDDDIELTGDGADLVFPGDGVDTVHTGDGDDEVVVLGACEIRAGEVLDGGEGVDRLVVPTDVCDLARRGVVAVHFEVVELTSPRADERRCDRPGALPPLLSAPTREQQAVIDDACGDVR